MMDTREYQFPGMLAYVEKWTVKNSMKGSSAYISDLSNRIYNEHIKGNYFMVYPEVIPAYFCAIMELKDDNLFLQVLCTAKFSGAIPHRISRSSLSFGDCYHLSSNYLELESLVKLIYSCSEMVVYHHKNDRLAEKLKDDPDEIMRTITRFESYYADESLFFERFRMIMTAIISIYHPGSQYFTDKYSDNYF